MLFRNITVKKFDVRMP